ncbi:MAG: DUF4058 family protein [Cyanosarcina radialis HA8281-LM2]|jgi:hypothetical protein|nr:DUF4058 family protein [Cyanosarcina radialis HA8281-LM2]
MIALLARFLVARLRPKCRVAIEHQIYKTIDRDAILVGIPDVTVVRSG